MSDMKVLIKEEIVALFHKNYPWCSNYFTWRICLRVAWLGYLLKDGPVIHHV